MKILIIGAGFIGKRLESEWGSEAVLDVRKIYTTDDALTIIDEHRPDVVINSAGVRGKPNVDWCEDHPFETVLGNTVMPIHLAEACQKRNLYLLHLGSGCVFYGKSAHPDGAWREDDHANPSAVYSRAKYAADLALSVLPNVGIARIRVPMDDRPGPHNTIDKLVSYSQIIDVENSVTVIPDMIRVLYALLQKKATGIFHVTNPGAIRYRDLIRMYEELVQPTSPIQWITEKEMVELGLTKKTRSTNVLATERLHAIGIDMPPVEIALRRALEHYASIKHQKTTV